MTRQRIYELSESATTRLAAQRKWVREHFEPSHEHRYESLDGKLSLVSTILERGWIEPGETVKLQALGVAFGDALVQKLGLRWVEIEDEYGRDPALVLEGTTVKVFPLTMLSKRVERGEAVDASDLFKKTCIKIAEIVREASR